MHEVNEKNPICFKALGRAVLLKQHWHCCVGMPVGQLVMYERSPHGTSPIDANRSSTGSKSHNLYHFQNE